MFSNGTCEWPENLFLNKVLFCSVRYEPPRCEKMYVRPCTFTEDSDQPAHPHSLIRVFAVRLMKHRILGFPKRAQRIHCSDGTDVRLIWIVTECTYQKVPFCFINPCPAEWIKMPCPNLIFSQSDYLIRIVVINSYTNGKQCRSRSVGFFRSQLIWIYTVCKGSVYPGSAGQGLILDFCFKVLLINLRLCKVSNQFRNSFW